MNGAKLPSRFHLDDGKYVTCMPHKDCPILQGDAPTVNTCWEYVSLPGRFRLDRAFNSTDPKEREKARRKAVAEYFGFMEVPTT